MKKLILILAVALFSLNLMAQTTGAKPDTVVDAYLDGYPHEKSAAISDIICVKVNHLNGLLNPQTDIKKVRLFINDIEVEGTVPLGWYLHGDGAASFFRDERICAGLIYRTGDLVRENSQREFEFVGRKDNLVKVRGFRISLDGIRQSLLQIEDVVDATVFARKEEVGDQLLIAHVKRRQGSTLQAADIRRQLGEVLSDYMIPASIILSDVLPITTNGKLDKTLLMSRSS